MEHLEGVEEARYYADKMRNEQMLNHGYRHVVLHIVMHVAMCVVHWANAMCEGMHTYATQ